ncbi:MAG: hypothetical protein HYY10_03410 [Candidatus Liptonbacteria bacterium]|nr:hypothetical protein [Candidatus Liptonbacteria bacterium]
MKAKLKMLAVISAATLIMGERAHGQVTITSSDMFNKIGQYYRAYANANEVGVSGKMGTTGGGQVWDFTSGPTNVILRFDYVAPNDEGHGADFPKATVAERRTDLSDGSKSWNYFEQVPGVGRRVYGFYDKKFASSRPSTPFSSPIVTFPGTIKYGDTWSAKTSYRADIVLSDTIDPDNPTAPANSFTIPMMITYSSTAKVDAFGTMNQPGVGSGDALRVNELVEFNIQADLRGDGSFQTIATDYVRTFYWLRPGFGITVQMTLKEDTFTTATEFIRMFETNHASSDAPVSPVSPIPAEKLQTVQVPTVKSVYGVCPAKQDDVAGLIVLVHGWIPPWEIPPYARWVDNMAQAIEGYLASNGVKGWRVYPYKWIEKAHTLLPLPDIAINQGKEEGKSLGDSVVLEGWGDIHFVAHSAGAALIQAASDVIKSRSPSTIIHLTFLDPYVGLDGGERDHYGKGANWSDYYFSRDLETSGELFQYTEGFIESTYNVDVTELDEKGGLANVFFSAIAGIAGDVCSTIVSTHGWPVDFYMRTITDSSWSDARGFGFPLSAEAGGLQRAMNQYAVGNKVLPTLVISGPPCIPLPNETTPMFADTPVGFGDLTLTTSSTGIVEARNRGLIFIPRSPVWVATMVTTTNTVNFLTLEAAFIGSQKGEGLLTIYWGTNTLAAIDERVTPAGLQKYTLPLPEAAPNGTTEMLGFRLDPFSAVLSSATVTNVALGFRGLREPFSLSFTGMYDKGLPVFQLDGPKGYIYAVESSTDLINWTVTAILANTSGTVRFTDSSATNATTRFYRAVAP